MTGLRLLNVSSKDGCEVSPKCTNCPLPECRYDSPVHFQAWKRSQERIKMAQTILELWEKGLSAVQIADMLKTTPRTVMKLAQEARDRLATNSITVY